MLSQPVLGAAPYHCTVSGQASGTLSRQSALSACRIGDSIETWKAATDADWLAVGVTKGGDWNSGCSYGSVRPDTFNGFPAGGVKLVDTFWGQSGGSNCTMVTTNTGKPASMYQVLANTNTGETFELGRVVVVSLLNAIKFQPNYGATPAQVIEMFNDVRPGGPGFYSVAGRTWYRDEVVGYLKLLYKA
jgi:hypothetical protein